MKTNGKKSSNKETYQNIYESYTDNNMHCLGEEEVKNYHNILKILKFHPINYITAGVKHIKTSNILGNILSCEFMQQCNALMFYVT